MNDSLGGHRADVPGYGRIGDIDDPVPDAEYGDDAETVRAIERSAASGVEERTVTQHAKVYQLADEAGRPRELRADPGGTSLSVSDLIEHYEFRGEEDVVDLADLWERWNHGSGRESQAFLEAETRILSIGDIVVLDGEVYRCDRAEWTPIELRERP